MKKLVALIFTLLAVCAAGICACAEEADAPSVGSEGYAEQFVKYVFSGEEGSEELMNKIILLGEQYKSSVEAGYTFGERMAQLVSAENLVVLAAACFLVICGVAFFVIESKRKKERRLTLSCMARLENKYAEETAANSNMRERIEAQTDELMELRALVDRLCNDAEKNKLDLDRSAHSAQAVAKMVKDVFLSSKTIDANGKSLLVHNYLEAFDGTEGEEHE